MARRPLLLASLGALLLAFAWLAFGGPPPQPAQPGAGGPAAAPDQPERPAPAELGPLAPGWLPGEGPVRVELRWLGARDDARSAPQLPGRLEGVIYGPQGKPAPGARVSVVGGPQDGRFARADAEGRYALAQLLGGTHFFAVEGPGFERAVLMQRVLERATTRRDFAVGATMELRLRVRDHENKPLAGAIVSTDLGLRSATTGEDGVALVPGVPAGPRVLVEISAAGYVPSRFETNVAIAAGGAEPLETPPLERSGSLRVAVRSWPGGPPPRVTVVPRATSPLGMPPAWERWQGVEVDREGLAVLDGLPTTHLLDVRVFHPLGTSDPPLRTLRPSADTPAVAEFVVRKSSASVGGVVRDEAGEPVAGALCTLSSLRPDLVLGRLYPGLAEAQTALPLPVPGALRRETVTGPDGAFLFAVGDHPEGTGGLLLTVARAGFRPARREVGALGQDLSLRLVAAARDGELVLERRDGGELPSAGFVLDGEERESDGAALDGLWPGFYEVVVTRGELVLLRREEFWVEGRTALDLSP